MADSLEVCAKATAEIFHHFLIYEFGAFCRVRDLGKVRGCLCLSAPTLDEAVLVGLGDQL